MELDLCSAPPLSHRHADKYAYSDADPNSDPRGAARPAHAAESASDCGQHGRLGSSIRRHRLPIALGRRWRLSAGNCGCAANRLHVYELKGWRNVSVQIQALGDGQRYERQGWWSKILRLALALMKLHKPPAYIRGGEAILDGGISWRSTGKRCDRRAGANCR